MTSIRQRTFLQLCALLMWTTATCTTASADSNKCRIWVHGVPDTSAIWKPVLDLLNSDGGNDDDGDTVDVTLSLPGFGSPVHQGVSTSHEYLDWLIETVDQTKRDHNCVHTYIIGHDWGGLLSWGLVNQEPNLVDRWMIIGGPVWPGYRWHKFAQIFQTPVLGELFSSTLTNDFVTISALVYSGVPRVEAKETARNIDKIMMRQILSLYRSAPDGIGGQWFRPNDLQTDQGIFVFGSEESFLTVQEGVDFANEIGTPVVVIENVGHWVPLEDPGAIATLLVDMQ